MGLLRVAAWRSRDYRRMAPRRAGATTSTPSARGAGRVGQLERRGIGRRIAAVVGGDDCCTGLAAAQLVEPLLVGVVARGDVRRFLLLRRDEFVLPRNLRIDRFDFEHERAGDRTW